MKASLSLLLTGVLMMGAVSLAFGNETRSENSDNKAKHASSSHKSKTAHHHSTGSHHSGNTNSGSKTQSNIPSN
jgi:hypothetical protein